MVVLDRWGPRKTQACDYQSQDKNCQSMWASRYRNLAILMEEHNWSASGLTGRGLFVSWKRCPAESWEHGGTSWWPQRRF